MAKLKYGSLEDLLKQVQRDSKAIAEWSVRQAAEDELKKAMWRKIYKRKTSGRYKRTFELYESAYGIVTQKGLNLLRISGYIDPLLMDDGHESWKPDVYGYDQRKHISKWMNDGHGGMAKYKETLFFAIAQEKFNVSAGKAYKMGMKQIGVPMIKR